VDKIREEHTYEVVCSFRPEKFTELENRFRNFGLRVRSHRQTKIGKEITCTWQASGSPKAHQRLVQQLFADEEVQELRY
jgi:hypothetical protein